MGRRSPPHHAGSRCLAGWQGAVGGPSQLLGPICTFHRREHRPAVPSTRPAKSPELEFAAPHFASTAWRRTVRVHGALESRQYGVRASERTYPRPFQSAFVQQQTSGLPMPSPPAVSRPLTAITPRPIDWMSPPRAALELMNGTSGYGNSALNSTARWPRFPDPAAPSWQHRCRAEISHARHAGTHSPAARPARRPHTSSMYNKGPAPARPIWGRDLFVDIPSPPASPVLPPPPSQHLRNPNPQP